MYKSYAEQPSVIHSLFNKQTKKKLLSEEVAFVSSFCPFKDYSEFNSQINETLLNVELCNFSFSSSNLLKIDY